MIASVIAKFNPDTSDLAATIAEIAKHPRVEIGELIGRHSLPMTIEADAANELEDLTRWMQSLPGIGFVDVAFVHLE